MKSIIHLKKLRVKTCIGVHDWEQKNAQDLVINASLHFDASLAAASDKIEDSIDYSVLEATFIDHIQNNNYALLEKLCSKLLDICLDQALCSYATIEIEKPQALSYTDTVSVEISKSKL